MGATLGDTIRLGNWPHGTTLKCNNTYYRFYLPDGINPFNDLARALTWDDNADNPKELTDCLKYKIGDTMTVFPPPSSTPAPPAEWREDLVPTPPPTSPGPWREDLTPSCNWTECKDWSYDNDSPCSERVGSTPNMVWNDSMSSYDLKSGCENWEMRAYEHASYKGDYFVM